MATARTAATGTAVDGVARLCDLAAHPVPTCVVRAGDGRKLVVERLADGSRPELARAAASLLRLHHPNIVHVRKVEPCEGGLDLFTDYVEGESLAELLKLAETNGACPPLEVKIRIVVDVLNGLSALHGHRDEGRQPLGLFHAHVTPSNVLVGADGATRLIHLLLPRARDASRPDEEAFTAPELARGEADSRSDIFSVGVLLDRAMQEASKGELSWAAPFADVVRRATLPDKGGRFATAAEMAAEVRKIAKAKVASPMIVSAAVDELASERIDARKVRLGPARVSSPPAAKVSAPSRPDFHEEAPTVPRNAAPELLRMGETPALVAPAPVVPVPAVLKSPQVPSPSRSHLPPPPRKPSPPAASAPVPATARAVSPPLPAPSPSPALAPPVALAPPPPPTPVAAVAHAPLLALSPKPEPEPDPVVLPAPVPLPVQAAPLVDPLEGSEAPIELDLPVDEPPTADRAVSTVSASATPPRSVRLARDRRKGLVLGVLGAAVVILIVAAVRSLSHGSAAATTAIVTSPVPPPAAPPPSPPSATVATTPSPGPSPAPTAATSTAPPADPFDETARGAPQAIVATPREAPPAPTPTSTARTRRTDPSSLSPKPKPGATYDPLGI
jgi:hypothetical protein